MRVGRMLQDRRATGKSGRIWPACRPSMRKRLSASSWRPLLDAFIVGPVTGGAVAPEFVAFADYRTVEMVRLADLPAVAGGVAGGGLAGFQAGGDPQSPIAGTAAGPFRLAGEAGDRAAFQCPPQIRGVNRRSVLNQKSGVGQIVGFRQRAALRCQRQRVVNRAVGDGGVPFAAGGIPAAGYASQADPPEVRPSVPA